MESTDSKHDLESPPIEYVRTQDAILDTSHSAHPPRVFRIWDTCALGLMTGSSWPLFAGSLVISLYNGGPTGVLYELIAITIIYGFVTASLAELASAIPTSSGVYGWATVCGGPRYGPVIGFFAGYWNAIAWLFSTTATSSITATLIIQLYSIFHDDYVFERWHVFVCYLACSWLACLLVIYGHRLLPLINDIGLFLIIAGVIIIIVVSAVEPAVRHHDYASSTEVWATWVNKTGWTSNGFTFVLGMLNGAFALGVPGMSEVMFDAWSISNRLMKDCVSHVAEEVNNPSAILPKAMFSQWFLGFLTTFVFLITVFYGAVDINQVVTSTDIQPIAQAYRQITGTRAGTAGLLVVTILPCFWAIIGAYVTAGRVLWTLGRANITPFSSYVGRLSKTRGNPAIATAIVALFNAALGTIYIGSVAAFNAFATSVIIFISLSYLTAVLPHLVTGRKYVEPGYFWMAGWTGIIVHTITCAYVVVFLVIFCFPSSLPVTAQTMNWSSTLLGGFTIMIIGLWFFKGRKK